MQSLFLILIPTTFAQSLFSISGNKVYYKQDWIVFNGIGLTCTQYMQKPGFAWNWSYLDCFGGMIGSPNGGQIQLNQEPNNVLRFLSGDNFEMKPNITKITFKPPFDQVLDDNIPQHYPIIRLPIAGSTYLYDQDSNTNNASNYRETLNIIIEFFTSNKIAVIMDLHMNCPDTTTLNGCPTLNAPMAAATFGGKPGAVAFWDTVSKRYANNPYVFYELYNEPHLQHSQQNWDIYYGGNSQYAGMLQMYDTIRANDIDGMIIMGGMQQYATDSQSLLAFYLKYKEDNHVFPHNILYNIHAYQGASQGLAKSLQAVVRLALSLKTIGPVIFTEFGQICCNNVTQMDCKGEQGECNAVATGTHFVFNMVNFAMQMDISFVGWGWRGNNSNTCTNHEPNCNVPDMRSSDGNLVTGAYGGANWRNVWQTFVSNPNPKVLDITNGIQLQPTDMEQAGYLPRPCIMGNYNLGKFCGYDLETNVSQLSYLNFSSQSIYSSILPGLPPNGNCTLQVRIEISTNRDCLIHPAEQNCNGNIT